GRLVTCPTGFGGLRVFRGLPQGICDARIRLAGMQRLRGTELPHPQGNPRRRPAGTQEVLPQGTQAYSAQRIAEEVAMSPLSVVRCQLSVAGCDKYSVLLTTDC